MAVCQYLDICVCISQDFRILLIPLQSLNFVLAITLEAHAHTFVIVDVVVHKNVHEDSTQNPRVL